MRGTSRGRLRGTPKIVGGLLAAAVTAAMASAVPATAEGARTQTSDPGHRLSPRLALVAAGRVAGSPATSGTQLSTATTGPGSMLRTPDGRLVVDLRLASRDAATVSAIEAAGGRLLPQPGDYGRLAVSVLPHDVAALADVPGVLYVGEEATPQVNGVCDSTVSAGDVILRANVLRTTGVDGTGVKVGVLSDSYDRASGAATNAAADIASDNLPGAANTCGHTRTSAISDLGGAGTDEGRAMMQIVHDLAPGSAIDFATARTSEPTFAANIAQLAAQGAKVIVDDVTYLDEPFYQDGIIEQAVSAVRAQGVDYFSAAGNNSVVVEGYDVGSYEAVTGYRPTACPAIAAITAGHTDCHNFGAADAPDPTYGFGYVGGQNMAPVLQWAEPWDGGVHTDLDMYLVNTATDTVIGTGSITDNIASQQALEYFGGWLGGNPMLALVIARRSDVAPSGTPRFKFIWAENGVLPFYTTEHRTPTPGTGDVMGPTVFGHNGGADAMSVGASDAHYDVPGVTSYSGYGPVTTLFGPVNGSTPAAPLATPRVVDKPDLVASTCTVTTFFTEKDPQVFCGTSAAAPHAAAVAALLRQRAPAASPRAINAAMVGTARRMYNTPASWQGGGLLDAMAAASRFPVPAPPPDTALTKTPRQKVKTTKRKAKVSFAFSSTVAGSTFTCSIDGRAFTPCASGVRVKLKPGKHTFAVRATAGGLTDPTPATYTFKVKRKHRH